MFNLLTKTKCKYDKKILKIDKLFNIVFLIIKNYYSIIKLSKIKKI